MYIYTFSRLAANAVTARSFLTDRGWGDSKTL